MGAYLRTVSDPRGVQRVEAVRQPSICHRRRPCSSSPQYRRPTRRPIHPCSRTAALAWAAARAAVRAAATAMGLALPAGTTAAAAPAAPTQAAARGSCHAGVRCALRHRW